VRHCPLVLGIVASLTLAVGSGARGGGGGPLFLIDDSRVPEVRISWPTTGDGRIRLEGRRAWGSKNDRTRLGHNLECFVAAGGTRLDKGAGHPEGAVVRVGFYKEDVSKLLFEDLDAAGLIEVELRNVAFNRSGVPVRESVLQHLQYTEEDVASCGLGREGLNLYNTLDPGETLGGKISKINTRFGALSGSAAGDGTVALVVEEDGTITLRARLPYAIFRHVGDPWVRTTPGVFLEPSHFHIEFEVLPEEVAAEVRRERPADEGSPAGRASSGSGSLDR